VYLSRELLKGFQGSEEKLGASRMLNDDYARVIFEFVCAVTTQVAASNGGVLTAASDFTGTMKQLASRYSYR
jgi:hypothetical protein